MKMFRKIFGMDIKFLSQIQQNIRLIKLLLELKRRSKLFVVETDVKNWWESKVNWAQLVGAAAMVATFFGYTVPADVIPQTVAFIGAAQAFVTFVMRTWFTKSLVWNSVDEVIVEEE